MDSFDLISGLSRRRALSLGCATAGGLILASTVAGAGNSDSETSLPVDKIEKILQASGNVQNGVLSVEIDRSDLSATFPGGIPVLPEFELNGTLYFQPLADGTAILNGDFCLKPEETNPFLEALIAHDLVVMAFHQHFFDLNPIFWFIHFRGIGDPTALATASKNAVNVTSTPFPQPPPDQTTPLDAARLAQILGGTFEIGGSGVVTVSVPRREQIRLAGIPLKPETGVSHTIAFEPLDALGKPGQAVGAPDFALIGKEVNPVFQLMRTQAFSIGCLYNQETDERPQLYFSHQWKVGNPYELAKEIRNGLDLTNSAFES
jgi:hypothetical protein